MMEFKEQDSDFFNEMLDFIKRYTDEDTVADTVKKAGFDPYEPKLLGITAMEKLLGKKKFAEILKDLVKKPQGNYIKSRPEWEFVNVYTEIKLA